MDVWIEQVGPEREEQVLIRCHSLTEEVREIEAFVKSRAGTLTGTREQRQYQLALSDVCYIESVDGRTFLYTGDRVYESAERLYVLEELLRPKHFLRISKAMLVNLMQIQSIQPAFNGRFTAQLRTGERLIISRSYVKALKAAIRGR